MEGYSCFEAYVDGYFIIFSFYWSWTILGRGLVNESKNEKMIDKSSHRI